MSDINTWGGTVTKGAAKPQFIVRRSWAGSTLILWLGLGAFVLGFLGAIVQSSVAPDLGGPIPAMLLGAGIVALPIGAILCGSRITVYDERYDVRRGWGRKRRRDVTAVETLRFDKQRSGNGMTFISVVGWDENRKQQFRVYTTNRGFPEFTAWLAQHRPEQWAKCEAAGVPD
ncbi:DUF5336 domain-containing protein [Curtobacterium sp. MCBA15_012]|uniref:DUF5336 domain-containing protein n=1 Tax=Curtobacterium sp. MCBA15_012 TaxID=1898738 RepID=UPI0008DE1AD3|nr:DUF5336 domain-containing protein [Curtobacterium sp. MCBA15_012]WIB01276.1 DUF5336 domain-containing protein [Curtobacterium sp. MCBA15_012]